jgi:hypothetical protein
LSAEEALLSLRERVALGEIGYAQAERMHTFLQAERMGVAEGFYPPGVLASRRREARKLGLAVNDPGLEPLDIGLAELLQPYRDAFSRAPE